MRITLLSILVVLFCVSTSNSQIAHWPLDGDTQEKIGGKHGVPSTSGVSWVTDDPQRGQVMKLHDFSGYVTLPSEIWTVPEDTNTTITCWYNWAGETRWQRVYSFGRAQQFSPPWACHYYCPADGDSVLHVTILGYLQEWQDFTFDTLQQNKWYFTAVVFKGDSLKIWLDNDLILAHDSVPTTPQEFQTGDSSVNVIGRSHWPADSTFQGMIDDFRIYGEALTDAQVLALFYATGVNDAKAEPAINLYGYDGRIMYSNVDESMVSEVSVYNIMGSLIFRSRHLSELLSQRFNSGIYLVNIRYQQQLISRKVAVIK